MARAFEPASSGGGNTPADFKFAPDWACNWICATIPRIAVQDPGDDGGGVVYAICPGAETRGKDLSGR